MFVSMSYYQKKKKNTQSVRSTLPFPDSMILSYFEVEILDIGQKKTICIGISDKNFPLNSQPGTEENSYGLLSDGKKHVEKSKGEFFSEGFTQHDIIGCGILFSSQEVFYTKNGVFLGAAFRKISGVYFPTIGLHSPGERVRVNFGAAPWRFDLDQWIRQMKQKFQTRVENVELALGDVHEIVRNYLLHYGYHNTLLSFQKTSDQNHLSLDHSLSQRKSMF